MAILNTSMISPNTSHEYALIVSKKDGTATIHHINKIFEKVSPLIHELIDVRKNPLNNRHFFVEPNPEKSIDCNLTLVSIEPQINDTGVLKFNSMSFLQAYIDIQYQCHFQPGAEKRRNNYRDLPIPFSFESFVKFAKEAYPADYEKWKLVDPDLIFTSRLLAIPSLK